MNKKYDLTDLYIAYCKLIQKTDILRHKLPDAIDFLEYLGKQEKLTSDPNSVTIETHEKNRSKRKRGKSTHA